MNAHTNYFSIKLVIFLQIFKDIIKFSQKIAQVLFLVKKTIGFEYALQIIM